MAKHANRWQKLNYLVTEPKCRMKTIDGELQIVEWKDPRPQPTNAEIDVVSDTLAQEKVNRASATNDIQGAGFNKVFMDKLFELENRVRIIEGGQPITQPEFIDGLVNSHLAL